VFDNQEGLEKTDLVDFGVAVGMNRSAFPTVVDEMEYLPVVDADRAYGADAGVHATPTVFVNGRALENPGWNYLQPAVDNALSN
jgi:protein-disulfide isomerase